MIQMILCTDLAGAIGRDNELLYNIKGDMKLFKEYTMGKTVVMGYNTWMSLPKKPLPGRTNIILTKEHDIEMTDDIKVARNIEDILKYAINDDIVIIGGASLYNKFIEDELADEIMLTLVQENYGHEADTFVNIVDLQLKYPNREFVKIIEDSKHVAHIYKFLK